MLKKESSISVLINSMGEFESIKKSIESIIPQLSETDELIIISPDLEMSEIVKKYKKRFDRISWVRDNSEGKPASLNLGFQKAKGDILVLTDGDVYLDSMAINFIKKPFEDSSVGAVSGHPVSLEKKDNMFGFWSHFLTDCAHKVRLVNDKKDKFIECSGYLYSVRKDLVNSIPQDTLAEDALISHMVANKSFKIKYAPNAIVYVKYPKSLDDWLKQKVRSTGGYVQKYVADSSFEMRSFWLESLLGLKIAVSYPRLLREFWWIILLFMARLYLWILVLVKVNILKQSRLKLWPRVLSTKSAGDRT